MIVTFRTKSFADITMFGDVAVTLLKLMGHSGTVPSAVNAEDIPAYLEKLQQGLSRHRDSVGVDTDSDSDEPVVGLQTRAKPLIDLMHSAHKNNDSVSWK